MKNVLTFLSFLSLTFSGLAKDKAPNVVTLLVDDLGYRDLGCYGGPVKTPVLDKLATGGVRFTDFHSGAPTCSPSRATYLTGRLNPRTGVYSVLDERFHRMHLLKSETTIAEVLKKNGYATAHFGKWHLGMPVQNRKNPTPADHGFDYWFGVVNGPGPSHKNPTNFMRNGERVGKIEGYSCQIVVDEALTWLDQKRDGDEPFFLNLWFNEPHDPIAAPDEIVSQYGALNEREAIYSGTIDNTDRAIGRLVEKLEKLGELDNTIIIYSSDNGSYLQERNGELRGKKGALFEGGHRVPGIVYWKDGIPGGRVEDEPAGAVDLLPTLCGLIGIDKPEEVHLDGSDLAPLLTGTGSFSRHQPLVVMSDASMVMRVGNHTLFASSTARSPIDIKTADRLMEQVKEVLGDDLEKELDGMNLRSRMFNGNFANPEANRLRAQFRKLYYFQESWVPELKKNGLGRVQLYDLSKDPSQKENIALKSPELAAQLKKQAAAIYRSVMADAPEWPAPEELSSAKKLQEEMPARPATEAPNKAKLLARIDKNPLPKGYHGNRHQAYVDKVMAGLKPEQQTLVSQLWKEKRRIDPKMPNRGASFIRILTHVAGDAPAVRNKTNRGSYYMNGEIHVNTYGQPEGKPLTTGHHDFKPSWSKTDDMLVFFRRLKNDPDVSKWKTAIHIINADGTGLHQLTGGTHTDFNQTWTRDGSNTPIWNRKNPKTGGYVVMASKVGAKPGEEFPLTDKGYHTWAYTCLTDGRILVRSNPPGQGMGYYLMTPGKNANPTFERLQCELANSGVLDRVSLSPTETRVCFEFQRGFKRRVPGRTLYVADFDTKSRTITNTKPFANEDGKPIWFAYPRWSKDESSIVYQAGGKLYLYKPEDGSTQKVSTSDKADYRYPHFEDAPK